MVKFSIFNYLSILVFTLSMFESCLCIFDQEGYNDCINALRKDEFDVDNESPNQIKYKFVFDKLMNISISDWGFKYIAKFVEALDESSNLFHEKDDIPSSSNDFNITNDKTKLTKLIDDNRNNLTEDDLKQMCSYRFTPKAFCYGENESIPNAYNPYALPDNN